MDYGIIPNGTIRVGQENARMKVEMTGILKEHTTFAVDGAKIIVPTDTEVDRANNVENLIQHFIVRDAKYAANNLQAGADVQNAIAEYITAEFTQAKVKFSVVR